MERTIAQVTLTNPLIREEGMFPGGHFRGCPIWDRQMVLPLFRFFCRASWCLLLAWVKRETVGLGDSVLCPPEQRRARFILQRPVSEMWLWTPPLSCVLTTVLSC